MTQTDKAFDAIKKLLVPYAKHFKVWQDTPDTYDLEEDLQYSRTMFGYLHKGRRGARLIFYPLSVFPELRTGLPATLAPLLKSKCVLTFPTVSAAQRAALKKLFADAWKRIAARRKLLPDRGYYRKPTLDETFALLTALVGTRSVTIERRPKDIALTLPGDKPIKLKTITPEQHTELAKRIARVKNA